jgi:hypothetical protein
MHLLITNVHEGKKVVASMYHVYNLLDRWERPVLLFSCSLPKLCPAVSGKCHETLATTMQAAKMHHPTYIIGVRSEMM